MSVKVIAQVNPFATERQEYEFEPCRIKDILKKIDASGTVDTGWRIMVNDEIISDYEMTVNDGDRIYVKVIPEGGSTKDTGKGMSWAGAAMIVAGAILTFTGYGSAFGIALIGAGVGCVAGGISLYNIDIPDMGKDRTAPEQDPSLRGSRNQMRERGYIPTLFGRRRIYSDLATQYYTWVEDGKQYLYQLFCCGQKDQQIDVSTIKIKDTLLAEYSSTGDIDNVLSGRDELLQMEIAYGEKSTPIVTKCVHESQHNSILNHLTDDGYDASLVETTVEGTEEIHVDIFFPNGLGQYNDKGEVAHAYVDVIALYKKEDEPDSQYIPLGHFFGGGDRLVQNQLKTFRYSIHKTELTPGKYTVKLTRLTADSKESKVIDKCYVGSIRSIKNQNPISEEKSRLLTIIGLKIRVSEKLNGIVDQLNFESQSILPVPTGTGNYAADWMKKETSSNPASCAIWAMQGPFAQQHMEDAKIDWRAFAKLYYFCQKHDYQCNAYLTESMTIQQLLSAIASTCRAEIFRVNGVVTVVQDVERESFVQLFTPRNSWDYEETISFSEIPDAMAVSFDNKDVGYASDELMIYNTPNFEKIEEPKEIVDIKTWGVTDKDQAKKLAIYKYAVTKNRPIIATFKCDIEYMLCTKGDWIKYAGDIAIVGIKQGRIASIQHDGNGNTVSFESDEVITMEDNKDYSVRVRLADSSSVLLDVRTIPGDNTHIFLKNPQSIGIKEQDLFAFGERDSETVDLIVTDINCEENLTASITAVNYAPEIFSLENPDFVLPDFKTNLSDYSGAIDRGEISQEGWKTFYTFNDSDEKPEAPVTDGTGGNWHRIQTSQSKWVSQKISRDIFSGSWSAPVRTGEAAIDFAENTRAEFERLLLEAQLKGSPLYSVIIDTPVIKKLEDNSYSPPEINCTSYKTEFSDEGMGSQTPFLTNWKITVNNEFVALHEGKSNVRLSLYDLIEAIKSKYALSELEIKNLRVLCTSINNESIIWDDEYIPVVSSAGGYVFDLTNEAQVYECYSAMDGKEYPNGWIKTEKSIRTRATVYEGLQALEYGKDWSYGILTPPAGFKMVLDPDRSNGELVITALEGADMAVDGVIDIPVFIKSSKDIEHRIGYVNAQGEEIYIGYEDGGVSSEAGYITPGEDSGTITLHFRYQKLTDVAARLAQSENFIRDISMDSRVTPAEKRYLQTIMRQIDAEHESYSKSYSEASAYPQYDSAYAALRYYIGPLLADPSSTSSIDRKTFNLKFDAYYTALSNLDKEAFANPTYYGRLKSASAMPSSPKKGDYFLCDFTGSTYLRGCTYKWNGSAWNPSYDMDESVFDALEIVKDSTDGSIPAVQLCKRLVAQQVITDALVTNTAYVNDMLTVGKNIETAQTTATNANEKAQKGVDDALTAYNKAKTAEEKANAQTKLIEAINEILESNGVTRESTIIVDGYLRTGLIDVETLVAKRVKSANANYDTVDELVKQASFNGFKFDDRDGKGLSYASDFYTNNLTVLNLNARQMGYVGHKSPNFFFTNGNTSLGVLQPIGWYDLFNKCKILKNIDAIPTKDIGSTIGLGALYHCLGTVAFATEANWEGKPTSFAAAGLSCLRVTFNPDAPIGVYYQGAYYIDGYMSDGRYFRGACPYSINPKYDRDFFYLTVEGGLTNVKFNDDAYGKNAFAIKALII